MIDFREHLVQGIELSSEFDGLMGQTLSYVLQFRSSMPHLLILAVDHPAFETAHLLHSGHLLPDSVTAVSDLGQ